MSVSRVTCRRCVHLDISGIGDPRGDRLQASRRLPLLASVRACGIPEEVRPDARAAGSRPVEVPQLTLEVEVSSTSQVREGECPQPTRSRSRYEPLHAETGIGGVICRCSICLFCEEQFVNGAVTPSHLPQEHFAEGRRPVNAAHLEGTASEGEERLGEFDVGAPPCVAAARARVLSVGGSALVPTGWSLPHSH